MKNQIRFPIGDWSHDGHGQCDWFIISSNKTVEEVREIHFKCNDVLGFEIGDICSQYGENTISSTILKILYDNKITKLFLAEDIDSPVFILQMWLDIFKYTEPSFEYKIENDSIPTIVFGGYDNKKRHLYNPGYGLYD